ncbi:MAG: hypothetical protein ACRC30_08120 [Clostridium sp.]
MMAKIDKFFIAELQERGYDFSYKTLSDIYKASRKRPDYVKNKQKKEIDAELMDRIAKDLIKMGLD